MKVTAVYASVDAEGVDDIDKEASMAGYKCASCGDGMVALAAEKGADDVRHCVHCGAKAEAVADASGTAEATALLEAEESALVAINCPSCLHKSISEISAIHANHKDGDDINLHCTECGSALVVEASAIPFDAEASGDSTEVDEGDGMEDEEAEAKADESDVQVAEGDDESDDDGDDESDDDGETFGDEGEDDEPDDEESYDDDDLDGDEASAEAHDDLDDAEADEAGANKNRDRRQDLKEALEGPGDEDDPVDDESEELMDEEEMEASTKPRRPIKRRRPRKAIARRSESADEEASDDVDELELAMGDKTHYIRMGDNSADIGFAEADDSTLARVSRVMARFPRLKVTRKPRIAAGKLMMSVRGRKAKACMDAMRREFGNIFDYAKADDDAKSQDVAITQGLDLEVGERAVRKGAKFLDKLAKRAVRSGSADEGDDAVAHVAKDLSFLLKTADKLSGYTAIHGARPIIEDLEDAWESYDMVAHLGDDDYRGYEGELSSAETAAGPRRGGSAKSLMHWVKLVADASDDMEETAEVLADVLPMYPKATRMKVLKDRRFAKYLTDNFGEEVLELLAKVEDAAADGQAESRDIPAISLVDEDADVTFASNGSTLYCMAGATCIASLPLADGVDAKALGDTLLEAAEGSSLREALEEAKFELAAARVDAPKADEAAVNSAREEASAEARAEIDRMGRAVEQSIGIAAMGVNRSFFDSGNPLAEKLIEGLEEAGMDGDDAEAFTAELFDEAADEYAAVVSGKAVEMMGKADEVRNDLASTLASVKHRAPARRKPQEVDETANANPLRDRLSQALKPSSRPAQEAASADDGGKPLSRAEQWARNSRLGEPLRLVR